MKHVFLCLALLVAMVVAARAQNGGQSHSNQFVSISNYGYVTDGYNLKITNKQTSSVSFRLSINDVHTVVGPVAAGASLSYHLLAPVGDCSIKIQCKPLSPGGPDAGQVEAKCQEGPDLIPLPAKYIQQPRLKRRQL